MRPSPRVLTGRRVRRHRAAAAVALLAVVVSACTASGAEEEVPTASEPVEATDTTETPSASETATDEPTDEPTEVAAGELPPIPDAVRGVYSHVYTFWSDKWFRLVDLVDRTELNAIVVDVKDEAGTLLWDIDHPLAVAGGGAAWRENYDGFEDRLQQLKDAGGWAIARVSCFKDALVAKARPELAVQDQSGNTWIARKDFAWLNPYNDEAGQWCIDVGLAALEAGFDEVQFDYIRFPNGGDGDTSIITLPGVPPERPREEWRHSDEIVEFLARATEQLHEAGGWVSTDLFGLVTYDFRWDAGGTGQVLERIGEFVDFISPMVYPSHYSAGNYGLQPHPIEYPYETVWNAMQEARMRLQGLHAQVRPWLEDFPAPWMGYPNHTPAHIEAQIRATYENGIDGWLLWNAANDYSESILALGDTESKADASFVPPARTADPDAAPGEEERQWPGRPPCDPYPGVLQVGQGNLAGSRAPDRALAFDDPRLCAGVPDGEEATVPWPERQDGVPSPESTDEPEADPTDAGSASEQG